MGPVSIVDFCFRRDNPNINFSIYTSNITGGTIIDMITAPFLLSVQQKNPDIIIGNLAANDGFGFRLSNFLTFMNNFQSTQYNTTCGKTPDIMWMTSWPHGLPAQNSGDQSQLSAIINSQYAASLIRSYCDVNGVACVDTWNMAMLVEAGVDYTSIPHKYDNGVVPIDVNYYVPFDFPFIWPTACHGYSVTLSIPISSTGWTLMGNEMQFSLSPAIQTKTGSGWGGVFRVGYDTTSGNYYYQVDCFLTANGADLNYTQNS